MFALALSTTEVCNSIGPFVKHAYYDAFCEETCMTNTLNRDETCRSVSYLHLDAISKHFLMSPKVGEHITEYIGRGT